MLFIMFIILIVIYNFVFIVIYCYYCVRDSDPLTERTAFGAYREHRRLGSTRVSRVGS